MVGLIMTPHSRRALFAFLILPIVLIIQEFLADRKKLCSMLYSCFMGVVAIAFIVPLISISTQNSQNLNEWDFLTFWLDGQVASRPLDFYDPANYREVMGDRPCSREFDEAILSVGFRYPPPTMFLFVGLGYLDFQTGLAYWTLINLFFLCICFFLIWHIFFRNEKYCGFLFSTMLLMLLPASSSTFVFSQTNFIALALFSIYWILNSKLGGGVFFALAVLTKPFLAVVALVPLLHRKWAVLLGIAATAVGTCLLSILFFGAEIFLSFFTDNPSSRMPDWVYLEGINQSLLSTVLRLFADVPGEIAWLWKPVFFLSLCALFGLSSWAVSRDARRLGSGWQISIMVLLSLMVYPSSMSHYSVFLIFPVMVLWSLRREVAGGPSGVILLMTTVYVLSGIAGGTYTFAAVLLLWTIFVGSPLIMRGERLRGDGEIFENGSGIGL